ncbi:MAG: nitroreductase family protein [Dehalococcoidia bacterium]|jgi:ferredoxin
MTRKTSIASGTEKGRPSKVHDGYDPSISIEISAKCTACGICVEVCPIGTLSFDLAITKSRRPVIFDPSICLGCGQCIAVCPADAISNNHLPISEFSSINFNPKIEWDEFIALTRQRRSVRRFSTTPVPKEIISNILNESTRYAPTGSNRQAVEIILIEGERLRAIRIEMNTSILRLHKVLKYTHWISNELELQWRHMRAWKRAIELGMDPSTRNAPLIMLFITDNRVKENETDAAILSYQTVLSAEILGLKTCYFGAIVNLLPFSQKLKKMLNLPKHRQVICGLLIGYTKIKYHKIVSRKPLELIS